MLKRIIQLVFLWRRNDFLSIALKSAFFGLVGGFLVGMFTSITTALITGEVIAGIAMIHYFLAARREDAKLLELFNGNKAALAKLRQSQKNGMAGAVITEFMRMGLSELDLDENEDEENDEGDDSASHEYGDDLSEEDRIRNRQRFQSHLDSVLAVIEAAPDIVVQDRQDRIDGLVEEFAESGEEVETRPILTALLAERTISTCMEDFCNDGDHAGFLELFAEASDGAWQPTHIRSSYDEAREQWVVQFRESGDPVEWRFKQSSDWISENFVSQLFSHIEQHSDQKIVPIEMEDFCEWLLVPVPLAARLGDAGLVTECGAC